MDADGKIVVPLRRSPVTILLLFTERRERIRPSLGDLILLSFAIDVWLSRKRGNAMDADAQIRTHRAASNRGNGQHPCERRDRPPAPEIAEQTGDGIDKNK